MGDVRLLSGRMIWCPIGAAATFGLVVVPANRVCLNLTYAMNNCRCPLILLAVLLLGSCDKETTEVTPPVETAPTTLSEGLIFHAPLAGNANDRSDGGLQGQVTGAVSVPDRNGVMNEAYRFDGEDDLINFGPAPALALGGAQPYTMTAWVKPEDLDEGEPEFVISKFNGGVSAGWYLGLNAEHRVRAYRNVEPWSTVGDQTIPSGQYVHLATTFDGRTLSVYVNGILQNATGFRTQPADQQTNVLLGATYAQSEPVGFFEGVIDDVRIYDRVLTGEEMTWLATH